MAHVLVAPDKFKGTLTAAQVAAHVSAGLLSERPGLDVLTIPVADGGDGTLAAAVAAGFERVPVVATGPTGQPVLSAYARQDSTAVVELAEVSGLAQLPEGVPSPLTASSRGTGELVAAALADGCRRIVLGIGGSACTDGGAGLLQALGARILDGAGTEVPPGGAALEKAVALDLSGLHAGLKDAEIVVACDVDNPLLGQRGAAAVYGPQKGTTPADIALLERALAKWAALVAGATGSDRSADPGAGAAGGVGFAALAVLGARLRPGIALMLELTGFWRALEGAVLVVTGEGSLDAQTLHGKAPAGVAASATAAGIPSVAVCGSLLLDPRQLAAAGFTAAYPLTAETSNLRECLETPGPLLERLGARIARDHLALPPRPCGKISIRRPEILSTETLNESRHPGAYPPLVAPNGPSVAERRPLHPPALAPGSRSLPPATKVGTSAPWIDFHVSVSPTHGEEPPMSTPDGIEITGPILDRFDEILTPEALGFLAELHRTFDGRRRDLLERRGRREAALAGGELLDFLPETAAVREGEWRVAEPAPGLVDRRVEITGPTDAKMTINALNSGAKVWLADHEDANTPLWENVVTGQLNLRDAIDRKLSFTSPEGKQYRLSDGELPTIVVRPRGWHLTEKHILVDGERTSGSLVDFALYFFHCARRQLDRGAGPYFYLPKMESHLEARLWNDVFLLAQERLGLPRGTIRATVLIETFPAAFEMEEILYELREHSAGLNAGRWDYMFSVIKKFRSRGADFLLPDRNSVTMTVPFMRAYTELLVRTCHKRGAHAIGGMAAFIPSRRDPEVNKTALAKVRDDKTREAGDGFDGSWVAHPDLVPVCREVFDGVLGDRPNQLDRTRDEVRVAAAQLLDVKSTPGRMTEAGLRNAVSVGVQYLTSWLKGTGAVAVFNMMEDAATAEISRSQVWQWLHNDVVLDDTKEPVSRELIDRLADEEIAKLPGEPADYADARALFMEVAVADDFADFLTLPAYERMP